LKGYLGLRGFLIVPSAMNGQSVVTELNEDELQSHKIVPDRMACTNCGFVARKSHPFLSEAFLGNQIAPVKGQILKEYGITIIAVSGALQMRAILPSPRCSTHNPAPASVIASLSLIDGIKPIGCMAYCSAYSEEDRSNALDKYRETPL
jgi:hypothetical protein